MKDRILQIMRAKDVSSRQFAEEIGIQPSSLSHIMTGRNKPSLDFVMKVIHRWPDIDVNWLMSGRGAIFGAVGRVQESAVTDTEPIGQMAFGFPEPPTGDELPTTPFSEPDLFSQLPVGPKDIPTESSLPPAESPAPAPAPSPEPPSPAPAPVPDAAAVAAPSHLQDSPKPQLDENRIYASGPIPVPVRAIPDEKRLVKVILLYSDHSFQEYSPQE